MSAGVHRGAGLCGKEWAAQAASSQSAHGAVGSPRHHFEQVGSVLPAVCWPCAVRDGHLGVPSHFPWLACLSWKVFIHFVNSLTEVVSSFLQSLEMQVFEMVDRSAC